MNFPLKDSSLKTAKSNISYDVKTDGLSHSAVSQKYRY